MKVLAALVCLTSALAASAQPTELIVFGSCFRHTREAPIWPAIRAQQPDVFMLIGDNVYADTDDMDEMRAAYDVLGNVPEYQWLKENSTVMATWDDHDYGRNDAGAEYVMKDRAQEVFLDFFEEPANSIRRRTPGIYTSTITGEPGQRVQFILLDTRYFRSDLETGPQNEVRGSGIGGRYVPVEDPALTMLGDQQWRWLEGELRKPAELRIIASSIQFVAEDHRYEKWQNLPLERERMLRLINRTRADGVVFISGDRHRAELSLYDPVRASTEGRRAADPRYPIYDLTSSALNQGPGRWSNELNRHRVGNQFFASNFGSIRIDWSADDPVVSLMLHDVEGEVVLRQDVRLSELRRDWPRP
ncbi:MAG: alkaline phosphatase D family protein [Planctomycetota bacterium]